MSALRTPDECFAALPGYAFAQEWGEEIARAALAALDR